MLFTTRGMSWDGNGTSADKLLSQVHCLPVHSLENALEGWRRELFPLGRFNRISNTNPYETLQCLHPRLNSALHPRNTCS